MNKAEEIRLVAMLATFTLVLVLLAAPLLL